jgi:5-methylcytosine-specific restriction endonuclease McrA
MLKPMNEEIEKELTKHQKYAKYNKEYRVRNRERILEWNKEWSARNKDKVRAIKTAWRERHSEYLRIYYQEVQSKLEFGGNKKMVLERDNYTCQECGMTNEEHIKRWSRNITVDHIDGNGRNSKTKNNNLDNLITLCLSCHGRKDEKRRRIRSGGRRKANLKAQQFIDSLEGKE